MILVKELREMARAKLHSSLVLFSANCYDDCLYLSGYAIEFALKAKVCESKGHPAWPETKLEFDANPSLKRSHNFEFLLTDSGIELLIKKNYLTEWSIVASWEVGLRYRVVGSVNCEDAASMIESVEILLDNL